MNVEHIRKTIVKIYVASNNTVLGLSFNVEFGVNDEDFVEDFDASMEREENLHVDDEVEGHDDIQELHPNIPFYLNVDLDNDGSITSRNAVEHCPLWDFKTTKLHKEIVFSDKKSLVHVVQLCNLKHIENSRF